MGNICKDCDVRVQIFHRLDDTHQSCESDIEVDVVDTVQNSLPPATMLPALDNCRPDTPIIVDDDDMLYDLFMQKVDQQRQQPTPLILQQSQPSFIPQQEQQHQQQFINHFNSQYTPPQSSAGGSEGDDAKILEVLTSRESTPASIATTVTAAESATPLPPDIVDNDGHRIVAIIDLDDEDSHNAHDKKREVDLVRAHRDEQRVEPQNNSQDIVVAQSKFQTDSFDNQLLTPIKSTDSQGNKEVCRGDSEDEEIVFRRVEPHLETPPSKKKKRKSYDDKELRLVASLSLLSSDSEADEPAKKQPKLTEVKTSTTLAKTNAKKEDFICQECQIVLPDQESLSVHESVHIGIKCPECQHSFSPEKRLVQHMRRKHRAYNGNVLKETARGPQDSAMTIRLRYKQRTTFYECQLCGRIDEIFKDHKDHIIKKHPEESKTLKDPIMKELKCPVCKGKCGTQYISLCRHLLEKHEYGQYKAHLRELVHVSAFGWNAARQQEVAKSARIFQFSKRKSFFFECKICHKVVAGYLNHLKHIKNHTKSELKEKSEDKKVEKLSKASTESSKKKSKNEQLIKSTKNTKQILQKDSKSCKKSPVKKSPKMNKSSSLITKKSIVVKLKKPVVKSNESIKTKSKESLKTKKKETVNAKSKETLKTKDTKTLKLKTKESSLKSSTKQSLKTKSKEQFIKPAEKSNISKPKNVTPKTLKSNEVKSNKRKRKDAAAVVAAAKPQVKKVKIKAPVKQINLQTYICNYCPKEMKGFISYNAHVRQEHFNEEFVECTNCQKTYAANMVVFKYHIEKCSKISQRTRRRKCVVTSGKKEGNKSNDTNNKITADIDKDKISTDFCGHQKVPEKFTKDLEDCDLPDSQNDVNDVDVNEPLWLKDLLKLNESKRNNSCSNNTKEYSGNVGNTANADLCETTTKPTPPPHKHSEGIQPCGYCLHLFASDIDLKEHTRLQHTAATNSKERVLVRYTAIQSKF